MLAPTTHRTCGAFSTICGSVLFEKSAPRSINCTSGGLEDTLGWAVLFHCEKQLRRTRHNVPLLAAGTPSLRRALLKPTDPLDFGVACLSSCNATCPCVVTEDVRKKSRSPLRGTGGHHKRADLGAKIGHHTGKDKTARRTSSIIALWEKPAARPQFFWADPFQKTEKRDETSRRNWKARTQLPPTICACTMVQSSS